MTGGFGVTCLRLVLVSTALTVHLIFSSFLVVVRRHYRYSGDTEAAAHHRLSSTPSPPSRHGSGSDSESTAAGENNPSREPMPAPAEEDIQVDIRRTRRKASKGKQANIAPVETRRTRSSSAKKRGHV